MLCRLIGSEYEADGEKMGYADLVGIEGEDEDDGGPPQAARYITKQTHPYRLPSMEIEFLLREYDTYRAYLEEA